VGVPISNPFTILRSTEHIAFMNSVDTSISYNQQSNYPCPVCRLGRIQAMSLMDVMACNTCRHMFALNVEKHCLSTVDYTSPLIWYWNGRNWIGDHVKGMKLGWDFWLISVIFVILPPTLIGLLTYVSVKHSGDAPPLFSLAWLGLTFLLHLSLVGLSIVGFYRFPVGSYFRALGRNLLRR
jgi:hypothetical protein